jgi:acetylornithine deacetylase/succinyl-diaminopimelate desuccinylase-like protein
MKVPSCLAIFLLAGSAFSALARAQLDEHFRAIDWPTYQDQAVQLLQEYLRIDTSNPPGNEALAAEFFHRIFDQFGVQNRVFNYEPGRADIYAVLKGDGTLRPLILLNHMDVVRADPRSWRAPPFAGEILNHEIYGRGALDMKDEGLLQLMVMLIAAREHLPLKRDLIFLATADEEVGDSGSAWFLANHADLVRGAEYLITEGGSNLIHEGNGTVYATGVAEKAPLWIRMTATGLGGHGSIPITDSATNRLVRAMNRILDWQTPVRLLPSVEQYFHEIAQLENEPRAGEFRNIRKALRRHSVIRELSEDKRFNYLLRDTISLTVLKGGEQTNVIPDVAYSQLDVRLLPGEDPEAFLGQLRTIIADNRIGLEILNRFKPPNSSSTDTGLYRIIEQVFHQSNPQATVVPGLNSGYTESQMYRPLGITCYGLSPVEVTPEIESTEHAANERVPVEQIRRGLKTLYEIVARAANE